MILWDMRATSDVEAFSTGFVRERKKSQLEVRYFSFYVVEEKLHVREIETLLIRISSALLLFNQRKKRTDLGAGNIRDYEPGTDFYERHYLKGRKRKGPQT
jgi:hypothetical protein